VLEKLSWIWTADGLFTITQSELKILNEQLLSNGIPDSRRAEVEEQIAKLEERKERLSVHLEDPQSFLNSREQEMELTIEALRTPLKEKEVDRKSIKYINNPPGKVPESFRNRISETAILCEFVQSEQRCLAVVVGRGGEGKTTLVCRMLKYAENGELPDNCGSIELDGIVYLSAKNGKEATFENFCDGLLKLTGGDQKSELSSMLNNSSLSVKQKADRLALVFSEKPVIVLLDNLETYLDPVTQEFLSNDTYNMLLGIADASETSIKLILTTRVLPTQLADLDPFKQIRIDLENGLDSPYAEEVLRAMDSDGSAGIRDATDEDLKRARDLTNGNPRALEALYGLLYKDHEVTLSSLIERYQSRRPDELTSILVGETFDRLERESKMIMHALAVYNTPVDTNAIDFLLLPWMPTVNSASVLQKLVMAKVVRHDQSGYFLHPIDAEHSLSTLDDTGESNYSFRTLSSRSAEYFRKLSLPQSEWKTFDDLVPLLREVTQRKNAGDYPTAARVLNSITFNYLFQWGRLELLEREWSALMPHLKNDLDRVLALAMVGSVYTKFGKIHEAIACHKEDVDLAVKYQRPNSHAISLCNLAAAMEKIGKLRESIEANREAMKYDKLTGDYQGLAVDYINESMRYKELGDFKSALKSNELGRKISQESGFERGELRYFLNLGAISLLQGKKRVALDHLEKAKAITSDQKHIETLSAAVYWIGLSYLSLEDFDAALGSFTEDIGGLHLDYSYRVYVAASVAAIGAGDKVLFEKLYIKAHAESETLYERCSESYRPLLNMGTALIVRAAFDGKEKCEKGQSLLRKAKEQGDARGSFSAIGIVLKGLRKAIPESADLVNDCLKDLGIREKKWGIF